MPNSVDVLLRDRIGRRARAMAALALLLVLALLVFVAAAHGQDPTHQPPPFPAGSPAAPHPASSWLTPDGLNVLLTLVIFVGMPLAAGIARRFGFNAAATVIETHKKDAEALRGALVSTVKGVEAIRKRTSFDVATDIARTIETTSRMDGTSNVLAAVVQAVTAPGASVPATPPPVAAADPVIVAVRRETGRLTGGAPGQAA